MTKQSVLVIGATGRTGESIVNGLLESTNFAVIAGVRPTSASKPEVNALKTRGVEIRILDLENQTVDQLAELLKGIDTVISAIYFGEVHLQKPLADACKKAGIKRFVPCDWATACVRGQREMHDQKCIVHDYVKEIGLGHTSIDVGWWMEIMFPTNDPSKAYQPGLIQQSKTRYGTGDVKTAVTARCDIGKFVAQIIADERTLNRYVFCWTQEATQNEVFALAERVSGHKFDIVSVSADELAKKAKEAENVMEKHVTQYMFSLWIRGDNTVENAKKKEYGEALDARELYPDIGQELKSLEESAKEFYSS